MRIPKDLAVWEYAPSRRLAEVTVLLKNVKGALAQCSKAVADMEVMVLSGFTSAASESVVGIWSFFADVTEANADLSTIRARLLELPVVESVEIAAAEDGFMVEKQNFPVRFSKRRALIMRTDVLTGMFSHLWKVFGSGAATILDQMAEAMGRCTAEEILADFGRDFAMQELDEILRTYTALGYADLEVRRDGEYSMTIHANSLFECESNAKSEIGRKSIFFRGHLRGFVSTLFDGDFEVTELECVAQGDKACSFNVARTERLATTLAHKQGKAIP
ncbi:MAG: hypothetical protein LYZ66_01370 [Nitrososphaerales archaeon]|nr:hypothetical protein [Nitrososphaerales archaeon]